MRVDGTSTAREVIAIVPFPTRDVQRSLFGLLCTGLVQHHEEDQHADVARITLALIVVRIGDDILDGKQFGLCASQIPERY